MSTRPVRPVGAGQDTSHKAVRMMADRVLVRRHDDGSERRSKAGLVIPPTASSVSKRGVWVEVASVGPHVRHVREGDEVLLLPEEGIEVEIRGEEFLLVREREIHAVASEDEDAASGIYL